MVVASVDDLLDRALIASRFTLSFRMLTCSYGPFTYLVYRYTIYQGQLLVSENIAYRTHLRPPQPFFLQPLPPGRNLHLLSLTPETPAPLHPLITYGKLFFSYIYLNSTSAGVLNQQQAAALTCDLVHRVGRGWKPDARRFDGGGGADESGGTSECSRLAILAECRQAFWGMDEVCGTVRGVLERGREVRMNTTLFKFKQS